MDEKRNLTLLVTAYLAGATDKRYEDALPLFEGELLSLVMGDVAVHAEVLALSPSAVTVRVQTTQKHTLVYNGQEVTLPLCEGSNATLTFSPASGEKPIAILCLLCMEASA